MYLLDANAFMEANRLYYAFDIAPGFWTWLGDPTHAVTTALGLRFELHTVA